MIAFNDYLRSLLDENRSQPSTPTSHWAGSPGRIETMRARWEAGESLWHPCDASEVLPDYAAPVTWVPSRNKFGR